MHFTMFVMYLACCTLAMKPKIRFSRAYMQREVFAENKIGFHMRNRFGCKYDIKSLVEQVPELQKYVVKNKIGDVSIKFAEPRAVKLLNKALLTSHYNLSFWEFPNGYLVPPVPGRAEYIHHLADLLNSPAENPAVRGLDIGTGASCIYPLIGHLEYSWSFVATDIDDIAIESASSIVSKNTYDKFIQVRRQTQPQYVFRNILKPGEVFDFCMCNPPFHSSIEQAHAGTERKWTNLKRSNLAARSDTKGPLRSFDGGEKELVCEGGEIGFAKRMIAESRESQTRSSIKWFTCLLSKRTSVDILLRYLEDCERDGEAGSVHLQDVKVVDMGFGNKVSQFLAWTWGR
jgi:23S rRNA (adenine1618-N6)-methyltransferase